MCYCQALFRFPRKRLACLRSRTVLAVRRPSQTDSSWRPWSSTGTRTASSVPAVTVASVRWGPLSSLRPTFSSVGGTISGKLIIIEVGRLGELAVYLSQVHWLEMRNWGWWGGGGLAIYYLVRIEEGGRGESNSLVIQLIRIEMCVSRGKKLAIH